MMKLFAGFSNTGQQYFYVMSYCMVKWLYVQFVKMNGFFDIEIEEHIFEIASWGLQWQIM